VIDTYSGSNIFIKYNGEFRAFKAEGLKLEKEKNPFCIVPSNGKVDLSLENKGEFKDISSTNPEEQSDCTTLVYNGDHTKKLDFVFVPANYKDATKFADDVNDYVSEIANEEPFKSNYGKLNFYRVDDISGLKCTTNPSTGLINCDETAVNRLASQCPNDVRIVLFNDMENIITSSIVPPPRSSSIGTLIKVTTSDRNVVVLHELGHAVGELADEYVDDKYYNSNNFKVDDYPNCDYVGCSKWDVSGCYKGCSMSIYYRPTESSIMRDLRTVSYGPVNEKVMKEKLEAYQ
jgi:hypothetical protein